MYCDHNIPFLGRGHVRDLHCCLILYGADETMKAAGIDQRGSGGLQLASAYVCQYIANHLKKKTYNR